MHIYYHTFGCKVNQYETENIMQGFAGRGHTTAVKIKDADVCIINSCTVTHEADKKLRQLLGKIRKENPTAVILLCGCYAQTAEDATDLADIVVGTSGKGKIPELVEEYISKQEKICRVREHIKGEKFERMSFTGSKSKTRAIIKIQDGCDRFCTYCIIPYARGRCRSKSLEDIEAEAKALVANGHRELCLVGINLSCYGQDLGLDLADAVEAVCKTSGADRVRLGSLEAELLSEDVIGKMAKCESLCPHFHLSLQSGCDKTLHEMGRKYDKAEYFTIVSNLRKYFLGCAITTDIMVGFPGESEEDFNESLEFVRSVGFADGHIFPYSMRSGTVAARRQDQVPAQIKTERAKRMSEVVARSKQEHLRSLIGKRLSVLFEKEKDSEWHLGHAGDYTVVKVSHFTDSLRYEIRNVLITEADGECCYGTIAD